MERLGIAEYARRRAGTLSLGNAQRLGLARAMIHRPEILLLDEPANGLDPAGIVEIRKLLLSLAENGSVVFVSSHILAEVALMATRIGIIHRGKLIQEADFESLVQFRRRTLAVRVGDPTKAIEALAREGYSPVTVDDGTIHLKDERALKHPEHIAELLVKTGTPPHALGVEEEKLEDYFLRLTGDGGEKR